MADLLTQLTRMKFEDPAGGEATIVARYNTLYDGIVDEFINRYNII